MVDVGADGDSGNEVRMNRIRHLFVSRAYPGYSCRPCFVSFVLFVRFRLSASILPRVEYTIVM